MTRLAAFVVLVSGSIALSAPASAAPGPPAATVLGQSGSFTSANAGATASNLNTPAGVAIDTVRHRMFVAESSSHRVTVFNLNANNTLPDEVADNVLGQTNFTIVSASIAQNRMDSPAGLAYDSTNDRLYVADGNNRRVLVFNTSSITNGMNAQYVLGQADYVTKTDNRSQAGVAITKGLALDGANRFLFVTDQNSHRVLAFDTNSIANGMNATHVIGQADFVSAAYSNGANRLRSPRGVTVDAASNRLYIADTESNRIAVYDLAGLATNMNASFVIGQASLTTTSASLSQTGMGGPIAVAVGAGKVMVVDNGYHRATAYDASVTTNGQPAIAVYGQSDYTSSTPNNGGLSAGSLAYPRNVTFDPTSYRFLVSDSDNNRVLGFNAVTSGVTMTGVVNPVFLFTLAGRATACNGQASGTFQAGSTATALDLGVLSVGSVVGAAQDLAIETNAANGFKVYVKTTGTTPNAFRTAGGSTIADVSGTATAPGSAPVAGTPGFGFTSSDAATAFTSNTWAKLTNADSTVMTGAGLVSPKSACVGWAAATSSTTPAGAYSVSVIYTAVPTF